VISMKKQTGLNIQKHALIAIENMTSIAELIDAEITDIEEKNILKRMAGEFIGELHIQILGYVYSKFPDLEES
jgi:hypothetical protein